MEGQVVAAVALVAVLLITSPHTSINRTHLLKAETGLDHSPLKEASEVSYKHKYSLDSCFSNSSDQAVQVKTVLHFRRSVSEVTVVHSASHVQSAFLSTTSALVSANHALTNLRTLSIQTQPRARLSAPMSVLKATAASMKTLTV